MRIFVIMLSLLTALISSSFLLADNAARATLDNQFYPEIAGDIPTVNDTNLKVETVAQGLEFPASMAFLGQNDILVTEKNNGTVQRVINGTIQDDPLLDVSVANRAERGMLGIAVWGKSKDRDESPREVYIYFTKSVNDTDSDGTQRGEKSGGNYLFKYQLMEDKLVNPVLLLNLSRNKGFAHNGGAIIFGPDKNLYIPVGDADGYSNSTNFPEHNTEAQNIFGGGPPDSTGGILTLASDGRPYANILGSSDPTSKYYAYGIRNSFGLDFDPVTGNLWDTENGESSGDEINLVKPGFNSGWKKIQGKAPTGFNTSQLVDFDGKGKYSDPEFSWVQTVGPTKVKFLNSDKLGEKYKNDIFTSDIIHGRIYHFELNEKRDSLILSGNLTDKVADTDKEANEAVFGSGFGGITDMDIGPDGLLYILSFGKGAIYKIGPK